MANRRIKVLTPTGTDMLEITSDGRVVDNTNYLTVPATNGRADLFVRQTNPNMTTPGVWVQLNPNGTLKTVWVENGL